MRERMNKFLTEDEILHIDTLGVVCHNSSYPDVDVDFSCDTRDSVKEYFIEKYGEKNVCSIGSIGYMKPKSVLKDLARINNIPLEEVNDLTTGEMKKFTKEDEELSLDELREKYKGFDALLKKYPAFEESFKKVQGSINCWGKHAGGVLVSDTDLTTQLPVRVNDGKLASCWTEGLSSRELGMMGFIKMDILAIDAINIIEETIALINQRHNKHMTFDDINLNDLQALKQMDSHDNLCIFQFDTDLTNRVVDQMGGINSLNDLISLVALMRPSSLSNKLPVKFGQRRKGEVPVDVPERLKPYLGFTYGLPVFQESAYHVAKYLAGFDNVSAYKFMKTLYKGKMKGEAVSYWKNKFMQGCSKCVIKEKIEIELEDGSLLIIDKDEKLTCIDGVERSIDEIIKQGIEIDDKYAKTKNN